MSFMSNSDKMKNNINQKPAAVALGSFDGVHIGHRLVILNAVNQKALIPKVFTFSSESEKPQSKDGFGSIYSESQRFSIIYSLGVKEIYAPAFSEVKDLSGEEFFRSVIVEKLCAKAVFCGENFKFGKNASDNVENLKLFCEKYGVKLFVSPMVFSDGEIVSSTRIRKLLMDGNIKAASKLLGTPYFIEEPVVHGNRFGRTIDFPTINQPFPDYRLVPKFGVYSGTAEIDGKLYPSLTNIGCKPTVSDSLIPLAETYIHGYSANFFTEDLYGRTVKVFLSDFLRPERKFSSIDELRRQIASDVSTLCK